jgi:hypothetical protein
LAAGVVRAPPNASCGCVLKVPVTAYVPLIVTVPVNSGPLPASALGLGVADGSIGVNEGVRLVPGLGAQAAHAIAVKTTMSPM